MIKNKAFCIKIIFETYFKIYETCQKYFRISINFCSIKKIKKKIKFIFKNYCLKVFWKTFFKTKDENIDNHEYICT